MAKLSALVIPAVIDTSGVDRGINQIKSKMSRVRGSGGVGGGISPGHSAGIVPYGIGDGFGGAAGAAMGAAFGAAAANRASNFAKMPFAFGGSRFGQVIPPTAGYARKTLAMTGANWNLSSTYAMGGGVGPKSSQELQAASYKFHRADMRASSRYSAVTDIATLGAFRDAEQAAMKRKAAFRMQQRIEPFRQFGRGLMGGMGTLPFGRLLPALGGIAAGAAVMRHIDPLNQQQRNAAPISQFAGTQNYAALAEMKSRAEASKGKFMSFGQAFDVGGMKAAGPYGSTFSETVGGIYGNMRQSTGELLGATMTNPMYGAAMMAAPGGNTAVHQAMTQGMEVAVGSVVLSIENAFKKLFN